MYRELSLKQTQETIDRLKKRISERFPDSGLSKVSDELCDVARETENKIKWIERPNWWIRISLISLILLALTVAYFSFKSIDFSITTFKLVDLAQIMEAMVNDIILIGAAIYFLFTIEGRIKRSRTLKALHELRAMAHVIDMHQLTKDPTELGKAGKGTASSPVRDMTAHELNRYLDYCGEMLSLLGKLAAIYAQHFPDETVLVAVNELEALTNSITTKTWQKIIILQGNRN